MSGTSELACEFTWAPPEDDGCAGTRGLLEIRFGHDVLWPAGDFSWTWWELLEWLTESWAALQLHDGLPVPVDVVNAAHLSAAARLAVDRVPPARAEQLEEELWTFHETHDLDRSLHGASRGPLLIWREGLLAHIATRDRKVITTWAQAQTFLSELGGSIAERIRSFGIAAPERWRPLLDSWAARDRPYSAVDLAEATGRDLDEWAQITRTLDAEGAWPTRTPGSRLDVARDELLVAARMTASLPVHVAVQVLQELHRLPPGRSSPALDRVSEVVSYAVAESGADRPHRQGYAAANALRRHQGLPDYSPFPLGSWLRDSSVSYREVELATSRIDALACWGALKAPAVVINTVGTHSRTRGGRQASLAHEVGHLLLDRRGALPAAEVLGGRVSLEVEQRAGAFAAELLVPRDVAGRLMSRTSEQSARELLRRGARRMGTSTQLFAHQALNSDFTMAVSVQAVLEDASGAARTI